MAVEQERTAEPVEKQRELCFDRFMVGAMSLVEPLVQLFGSNGAAPEIAVLRGPARNDAEAASCTRADAVSPRALDHRRIDLILAAIAVDRGAWRSCNDRAAAALESTPHETVDKWVFERRQRRLAGCRKPDQPVRIIPSGMWHRQQYRQLAAWRMDGWGGELVHGRG